MREIQMTPLITSVENQEYTALFLECKVGRNLKTNFHLALCEQCPKMSLWHRKLLKLYNYFYLQGLLWHWIYRNNCKSKFN
jgi:hypothetical protein